MWVEDVGEDVVLDEVFEGVVVDVGELELVDELDFCSTIISTSCDSVLTGSLRPTSTTRISNTG